MDNRAEFEALKTKMQAARSATNNRPGGYMSLSKDEQKRYSAIKKELESEDNKVEIPRVEDKSDKIVVSKSELEALKKQVSEISKLHGKTQELESKVGVNEWKEAATLSGKTRRTSFRLWRDNSDEEWGLVIGFKFHENVWDENTRKNDKPMYKWTILAEDGSTKEVEVGLLDMVRDENRETVEVIKSDIRELVMETGEYVRVPEKEHGYVMSAGKGVNQKLGSTKKELIVTKKDGTYTLRRASGQEFTVKAINLNM